MRVAIVAGEASGDQLGAGLITVLQALQPELEIEAVAGPALRATGATVLADSEELAVMGLAEVLPEVARLWRLRKRLINHWKENPPDVFIGVDAPDFNLGLARALRRAGVPTVHYVSPTVWAWRAGRVHGIARAAQTVLCLFPFEPACYRDVPIRAIYVGHPFAAAMASQPTAAQARSSLGLEPNLPLMALVPGSRAGEVGEMGPRFLTTARELSRRHPQLQFVLPAANDKLREQLRSQAQQLAPDLPLTITQGQMRLALRAADLALVTSGTATLETLLARTPMLVAYHAAPVTAFVLRGLGLLRSRFVSLPNILAGRALVPEFLQAHAEPRMLAQAAHLLLSNPGAREAQQRAFAEIAASLTRNTNEEAARAVLSTCAPA